MLISTCKANTEKDIAYKKGKAAFIADLLTWHRKVAEHQRCLEASYVPESIDCFCINVWDDFADEEGTYAYVEMQDVPDRVCFDVLNHLLSFANENPVIRSTGATFGMRFFDASIVWPALIGNPDSEFGLFKRWEITIAGIDLEALETVVQQLQGAPKFMNKRIDVLCES